MAGSWGELLVGTKPPTTATVVGGTATGALFDCPGGLMVFACSATAWNGATATLQMVAPDGTSLITVSATQGVFTANGAGQVNLPPCTIQCTVTGGPPTSLLANIARVVG